VRPEVGAAARELLQRLDETEHALEATNLTVLRRKLDELFWDEDFAALSKEEKDRVGRVASAIQGFDAWLQRCRETTYTTVALSHVVRGSRREDVLHDLEGSRWAEKHAVLTRWAWCLETQREIAKGKTFNRPFLCEWGPREGLQKLDREFHILLRFLPLWARSCRRRALLEIHRGLTHQSPDFDLRDELGALLGLEVTEVLLDVSLVGASQAEEEKCREKVVGRLNAMLGAEAESAVPGWSMPVDDLFP
jgi:hypothetical protein